MKQVTTQAIVLKRLNFGEADRILTVITADNGKMTMFGKGVRRAKSKLAGGLELFSVTDLTFIDGRGDMKTLTSTRLKTHYGSIVQNVDKTMAAYDFMKYIAIYAEHSQDTSFYELLESGLNGLNTAKLPQNAVYIWFVLRLLQLSGASINLEKPLNAPKFQNDKKYTFSYDDMCFLEDDHAIYGARHMKLLRLLVTSESPTVVGQVENIEELADELVELLKTILRYVNQES